MIINNKEINIDDLVSDKYMHKMINKNIYLSDYQIEVLRRFNINPYDYNDIKDLIYIIEEVLEEQYEEEIDNILLEISEFNYYSNTNK